MSDPKYTPIPLEHFEEVFKNTSTEVSSVALGGKIVSCSDEFFAEADNLLKVHPSVSMKGQFGPKGALYDGWETRRHNPDYDWVIIRLGPPTSLLTGFDIDTANFTGNEGPAGAVYGLNLTEELKVGEEDGEGRGRELERLERGLRDDDPRWELLLPKVPLGPSSRHLFQIETTKKGYSHVKLLMIPDGGFGRFRAYDLAYSLNGGRLVSQSDQHFGIASNLLLPGRGVDMGDGWESKRSRREGNREWAVVRLGGAGYIDHIEIDTAHHMGNFPMYADVQAIHSEDNVPAPDHADWVSILPKMKMGPHRQHFYPVENAFAKTFTHVKLTIWPDGGLKRLRIMGYLASAFSPNSLPTTHITNPLPQLEALPLTYEAFLPFGKVLQAFSAPTAAPRGLIKTTANQGTAAKYHKMARLEDDYKEDGSEGHRTVISPMRCEAKTTTGSVWDVKQLERHPRTTQAFIPLGSTDASGKGSAASDASYIVTVALEDEAGKPDLKTLRSFLVPPSQGIQFDRNVWHHGTLTADSLINYACIETIAPPSLEAGIEIYNTGSTLAQITVPTLPKSATKAKPSIVSAPKTSLVSSFKSAVSAIGSSSSSNITCQALTHENFKAFGNVIQTYANPSDKPEGVEHVVQPDGKTIKYFEIAPIKNSYPKEAKAGTGISVFRCTVKDGMEKGKAWPVHLMERHPYTEQAFIPMGASTWTGKGEEALPTGTAYIIITALNGSDDRPDPSTIKAFFATADQGVNYHTGVWHHPMLTVGGPIDFACVETQINHLGDPRDCELLEFDDSIAEIDIPNF